MKRKQRKPGAIHQEEIMLEALREIYNGARVYLDLLVFSGKPIGSIVDEKLRPALARLDENDLPRSESDEIEPEKGLSVFTPIAEAALAMVLLNTLAKDQINQQRR